MTICIFRLWCVNIMHILTAGAAGGITMLFIHDAHIYHHTQEDIRQKEVLSTLLVGLVFVFFFLVVVVVVEVCGSPEHTAPGCISAGDAFDDAGVRTRHRLRGRDSVVDPSE
jgi:hypothetical protein